MDFKSCETSSAQKKTLNKTYFTQLFPATFDNPFVSHFFHQILAHFSKLPTNPPYLRDLHKFLQVENPATYTCSVTPLMENRIFESALPPPRSFHVVLCRTHQVPLILLRFVVPESFREEEKHSMEGVGKSFVGVS